MPDSQFIKKSVYNWIYLGRMIGYFISNKIEHL